MIFLFLSFLLPGSGRLFLPCSSGLSPSGSQSVILPLPLSRSQGYLSCIHTMTDTTSASSSQVAHLRLQLRTLP